MASIIIKLRKIGPHEWRLFSPKNTAISEKFRGERHQAIEWASAWISTWYNWTLEIEGELDEKEGRVPR